MAEEADDGEERVEDTHTLPTAASKPHRGKGKMGKVRGPVPAQMWQGEPSLCADVARCHRPKVIRITRTHHWLITRLRTVSRGAALSCESTAGAGGYAQVGLSGECSRLRMVVLSTCPTGAAHLAIASAHILLHHNAPRCNAVRNAARCHGCPVLHTVVGRHGSIVSYRAGGDTMPWWDNRAGVG